MVIILASSSPRRRELLSMLGLEFIIAPSDTEVSPEGLPPDVTAVETARGKARDVASHFADGIIIAADTVVHVDGTILGKPGDFDEARAYLRMLSGRTHEVFTGLCVVQGAKEVAHCEKTVVRFRDLTDEEIARYVETGEPMDKAGAYGAQGRGALFIAGIDGDFFNVMGLPVCALGIMLREFDVEL